MTCSDVERLLDAFIDRELPTPMLLEVARHASGCGPCDETVRQFAALGGAINQAIVGEAEALDLSSVWPVVSRRIDPLTTRRRFRERVRVLPAWVVTFAAAASLAVVMRQAMPQLAGWVTPQVAEVTVPAPTPPPVQVARVTARPHQAVIDRLAGKNVAVRSEPKGGSTMIWVNYPVGDAR
jgi:hypothetical protein